jgi:hypothetical protein
LWAKIDRINRWIDGLCPTTNRVDRPIHPLHYPEIDRQIVPGNKLSRSADSSIIALP